MVNETAIPHRQKKYTNGANDSTETAGSAVNNRYLSIFLNAVESISLILFNWLTSLAPGS